MAKRLSGSLQKLKCKSLINLRSTGWTSRCQSPNINNSATEAKSLVLMSWDGSDIWLKNRWGEGWRNSMLYESDAWACQNCEAQKAQPFSWGRISLCKIQLAARLRWCNSNHGLVIQISNINITNIKLKHNKYQAQFVWVPPGWMASLVANPMLGLLYKLT